MCMIDDAEPNAFFNSAARKARKAHKCGECSRVINPGETYQYASGLNDGSFWTAKQCRHCAVGADLLVKKCSGFLYGEIFEDLDEHINEALPWSRKAARLVIGMRRRWQRFDGKGLMPVPNITAAPKAAVIH